jgi:hypothetical protein
MIIGLIFILASDLMMGWFSLVLAYPIAFRTDTVGF